MNVEFSDPMSSQDEVETRRLMMDGVNIGLVKAYKATEEEAKTMTSKLKKKIKPGQIFSVKVFLDKELDEGATEVIAEKARGMYGNSIGKVYFVIKTHDSIIPLRMR